MKISKRENFLLGILIALLIIFAYYQFIYTNQVEKLNQKREEKAQIEEKYNGVMSDIESLDKIEEDLKALKVSISDKSKKLYPIIMQEKIIIEIDKLLNDSKLSGNIAFSPIEVAVVESMKAEEVAKAESSLKELVDEYEGNEVSSVDFTNNEVDGSSAEDSSENVVTSEQLKIAINFNGSYENLKNFISAVEKYDRKIVITNISITANSQDNLSGVMNLEFHAVPKLSGEDEEYLEWTLKNVYGKDILFSSSEATGAYSSTIEEQNNEEDLKDFVMMLRSPSSELPTLTMGKAKDDLRESYIYSDNEKTEYVEITFDEIDGKTYFKYKTSSSYYPNDTASYGKEFTPKSNDIIVEILSENRNGDSDNSGIKLSVINNTSKNVEVIIEDDDTSNPRVSVTSKGNTVNITKK
jgi:type IV pilus assembly protein PilO